MVFADVCLCLSTPKPRTATLLTSSQPYPCWLVHACFSARPWLLVLLLRCIAWLSSIRLHSLLSHFTELPLRRPGSRLFDSRRSLMIIYLAKHPGIPKLRKTECLIALVLRLPRLLHLKVPHSTHPQMSRPPSLSVC